MIYHRTTAWLSLTVAAALLVSGCGSGGGAPGAGNANAGAPGAGSADGRIVAPDGAGEELKKEYAFTNEVAACMRKSGFGYVAWVPPSASDPAGGLERDYGRARQVREKYGFGVFAAYVYPDDPERPGSAPRTAANPNDAVYAALSPEQKAAWDTALTGSAGPARPEPGAGCLGEARLKVYGERHKSDAGGTVAEDARTSRQALDGDPQLVGLAQGYANCLRGKGHVVADTAVTRIRTSLQSVWFGKAGELTAPQDAGRGAPAPAGSAGPAGPAEGATLDPSVARAMLAQEIQAALDDLDCGREFRAAYFPRYDQAPGAEGVG